MAAQSRQEALPINVLLLGTSGCGKSSTGNSILFRYAFQTSNDSTSTTRTVQTKLEYYKATNGKRYRIQVTDGPGLRDTHLTKVQDNRQALANIGETLRGCRSGIHEFLFVVRMSIRFTKEDEEAYNYLKRVLGKQFMNTHGIVVVAGGDSLKEDNPDLTFDVWCQKQTGSLKVLFQDCNNRRVLFHNRIKKKSAEREPADLDPAAREQMENLLTLINTITEKNQGKAFTTELFRDFNKTYQKLLKECSHEAVQEEFCRELDELEDKILEIQDNNDVQQVITLQTSFAEKVEHEYKTVAPQVRFFQADLKELRTRLDILLPCNPGTHEFKSSLQDVQSHIDTIVGKTYVFTIFKKHCGSFNISKYL